jgi:uncharacterized lipoprotein YehR (DUF1307 family)
LKYLITITCALALTAMITSCGGNEGSKTAPSPTPQASAAISPAPSVTPAPSITPGPGQKDAKDYDFRGTKWGMSMAEVRKAEPYPPRAETADSLTYKGKYKDILTLINYKFKDDKLFRTGIIYSAKLDSAALYVNNYEEIKKDVTAAYGKPVLDGEKQTNPEAVIAPDKKADAVCNGDLMYAAQWNLPRSMVILMLRGNGHDCLVTLNYIDMKALQFTAEQDGDGSIDIPK